MNGLAPSGNYASGVGGSNGIFVCLPIVVFAYSSQQGLVSSAFSSSIPTKCLPSALFPIYSDLRGVPDLTETKGCVNSAPSELGALNRGHADTNGHADVTHQASEALVASNVSSSDIEESHLVKVDDAEAGASADAGLVLGKQQDSQQNLQDMKLIVRITMVGHDAES
jgi:hypothetical protein